MPHTVNIVSIYIVYLYHIHVPIFNLTIQSHSLLRKQKKWVVCRNCSVLWNRPMMSLFTTPSNPPSSPRPPLHSHLLVCLPFAAVRIKLYLMAAIASPCILASANPKSTFPLLCHVCCKCWTNCLLFLYAQKKKEKEKKRETELHGGGSIWLASRVPSVDLTHVQLRTDGRACAHADAEVERVHHQVSPLTWPRACRKLTLRSV